MPNRSMLEQRQAIGPCRHARLPHASIAQTRIVETKGTPVTHSSLNRGAVFGSVLALLVAAAGCSGSNPGGFEGQGDQGSEPEGDGGSFLARPDSGAPDASERVPDVDATAPADTSAPAPGVDSSVEVDSGPMAVTSADGFGPSRTVCITTINALRATDTAVALQPYTLEDDTSLDMCVDTQATNDEAMNSAHYSFINSAPACGWGTTLMMGNTGQNECAQGYGTTPAGIQQCLQDMWNERLQPNCTGCIGCTAYGGACPNCDFYGMSGPECGHYVNMSAPYYTQVACGFGGASPSSGTAWAVQNFE